MSNEPLVAVLLHSLECGGVERITVNMLHYLTSQGQRVDVLLRVSKGEFIGELPPGVRVVELGRSSLGAMFRLASYLRRERPRNILSLMYPQNELALLTRMLCRVPVRIVVSVRYMLGGQHEIVAFRNRSLRHMHAACVKTLARLLYRYAEEIVTVSDGAARDIAAITRLPEARITVIRNPVIRPQLFTRAAEAPTHRWLSAGEPPVILALGRLHPIKDFTKLIEAFAIVRQQRDVRLLILGDGPEMSRLRCRAQDLGVSEDVELPGFVANPYPAIRAAALLALTSRFEALPAVLIEALAIGTPVVSTDCPSGPSEILENGRYGELVPVGAVEQIAAAIIRVLDGRSTAVPANPEWLDQFREEVAMYKYLKILLREPRSV